MTTNSLSADTQAIMSFEANKKSAGVAYLLWFFTGGIGGHRFYMGRTGSAIAQLILSILGWLTIWAAGFGLLFLIPLGIWLLVDVFTLGGMVSDHNNKLMQRLNAGSAPRANPADELAKFAALRDSGAISNDEYEAQKRRLLGVPDAVVVP
ncbi:NINE protein [Brevundimonas diminuta]|nr:NINE protein [Brevundimonas diminuta]